MNIRVVLLCFLMAYVITAAVEASTCDRLRGNCQDIRRNRCSTGYVSGLCPRSYYNRCCYPSSSCNTRRRGQCKNTRYRYLDRCSTRFVSGYCPGPSYVKCCEPSRPSGRSCGSTARRLACSIRRNRNIILATSHPSGVRDNAYASLNIRDVCNGQRAKRSSYRATCPRGVRAPGGETCLSVKILLYVLRIARRSRFRVNEFAGACHSARSKHYSGRAVDLAITPSTRRMYRYWMSVCESMGGDALGPGRRGHDNHVHCEI